MDLFDVTRGYPNPKTAFAKITAKTLVVSVDSDILFTPQQQHELAMALQAANVDSRYIQHQSNYGHDTFLVETDAFGNFIREFIA